MTLYIIDFVIFSALVIGLTAMLGVISTSIGEWIFGHRKGKEYYNKNMDSQKGWRKMTRD